MNAESILVMNIKKNKFMIEGETSMMISDEKAQEELDKTTNTLNVINKIELYSLLMKIKYSDNREKLLMKH